MRCTPMRDTPICEVNPMRYMSLRDTSEMHAYKVYVYEISAYEGVYEDLARQNIVVHLSQLQLGFRRCRTLVSVIIAVS
jgi:hypothetical protein